ncbi:MAG TPA: hypothetical protein VHT70_00375 [Candidatus Saccharimonadales bacterium]|jgi:hypothetical protein|nr:hypothetical protein [Candidatus Saccharimonadales bacterium]
MRYFEFSQLKLNDYIILEEDVPSGTRPRYVLKNKISNHKFFLKTYSQTPREIWAEVFASKVGQELGIEIQNAVPKKIPQGLEDRLRSDFGPILRKDWQPIGVISKDVFPKGFDQLKGGDLLETKLQGSECFDLTYVESKLRDVYYASDDLLQDFANMIVFDFIIGNMDRHQDNWAVLQDTSVIRQLLLVKDRSAIEKILRARTFCPLFDHGSSLLYEIGEQKVKNYLQHPDSFIQDYILNNKGRYFSLLGKHISAPNLILIHSCLLKDSWGERFMKFIKEKVLRVDLLRLTQIILQMPNDELLCYSYERKKLLNFSVQQRIDILRNIALKGTIES